MRACCSVRQIPSLAFRGGFDGNGHWVVLIRSVGLTCFIPLSIVAHLYMSPSYHSWDEWPENPYELRGEQLEVGTLTI